MSAGAFEDAIYQATYDPTAFHPVKVQEETLLADIGGVVNASAAGPVNNPIVARATGGKREIGLGCRRITLVAPSDPAEVPTGYLPRGRTTIPALTSAFYAAATKGATCVYLGSNFRVAGRSGETPNQAG